MIGINLFTEKTSLFAIHIGINNFWRIFSNPKTKQ